MTQIASKEMKFSILEGFEYSKLIDLAKDVNLKEAIDFKCTFLAAKDGSGKILGAAGIRLDYDTPKFEHIIVRREFQKKGLALKLMNEIEDMLIDLKFKIYASFILHENKLMRKYALKFGYKQYKSEENGDWFYKTIGVKND